MTRGGRGVRVNMTKIWGGTANSKNDIDFGVRGMIKNDQITFFNICS